MLAKALPCVNPNLSNSVTFTAVSASLPHGTPPKIAAGAMSFVSRKGKASAPFHLNFAALGFGFRFCTVFILFDAYGTLVELDDFYGRLQRGFACHGVVLCDRVVRQAAHVEMRYYMSHVLRARDLPSWENLRRECAQVLGDAVRESGGRHDLLPEILLEILAEAIVFRLYPETREVLEILHSRGVPMGVLSNWDYQLPQRFEELDLARYFHFVLSSSQAGLEKPGVELFHFGFEAIQKVLPEISSSECLYVGDHYEKDVKGAQSAGFKPVWIVRDERDLPSGDTPHDPNVTIIKSLRELLEMNW